MSEITYTILLCALANYILRAGPFWLSTETKKNSYIGRVLDYLPITALGALIFPGILTTFPNMPIAGIAGIAAAALTSWYRGGLILPVFASIITAWICLNL